MSEFISFQILENYHELGYRAYDLVTKYQYSCLVYIDHQISENLMIKAEADKLITVQLQFDNDLYNLCEILRIQKD